MCDYNVSTDMNKHIHTIASEKDLQQITPASSLWVHELASEL